MGPKFDLKKTGKEGPGRAGTGNLGRGAESRKAKFSGT